MPYGQSAARSCGRAFGEGGIASMGFAAALDHRQNPEGGPGSGGQIAHDPIFLRILPLVPEASP
jgi:hypothetical protein